MRPARDSTRKPDLAPALRQALEAVLKRASPTASTPGPATPAPTRAQKRPIRQPDLRAAPPPRITPKAPVKKIAKTAVPAKPTTARKPTKSDKAQPPIKTLQDLQAIKLDMQTRAQVAAQREAARAALEAKTRAERELFSRAVGVIKPLPVKHRPGSRASVAIAQPAPIAVQQQRDEMAVMREALSDGFDGESLLDSDEALSFRRPGMGPDVVRKLRRGEWSIQGQLDLHGLRREDARDALSHFIKDAHKVGWRCVRVVHGKGLGSPGKTPVLKGRVQSWLMQKEQVLAFAQARPADGGAGALVVLLAQG